MLAKYRHAQPQMKDALFLSDGGQETTLIFHHGLELPHFASFVLLDSAEGRAALTSYYMPYVELARHAGRLSQLKLRASIKADASPGHCGRAPSPPRPLR